ncbi:hypothetical protein TMatcc_000100 [Talaromyces marneffei ATCC 18224]|uniref:Uncharacterized protein n=1 Tax=Talaromyces marneffei (strain ATCC 18224 / CBS 334.59 / QM 7333) TaxID=441960 RepID=B6QQ03_TALMQ|nr:uncharacterized protein EYB26_005188 [Talaromyces marneffei]EEA20125.1 conserved hypothetical protein [Talaromyces marneffei ATCC 18224]KAE8549139.1 hypothetical protein EYB25_007654 [Talaromyces marneffei]QGA17517.1 hypothetical protein EYB26_005188 [Talaromyces marneffei]
MDTPALVHPNFARPAAKNASPSSPTSALTTTSPTTTQSPTHNANSTSTSTIQYDHETYLELLAGESNHVEKTANQIYEEERARELSLRAQDPAVLSGPLDLDVDVNVYRFGFVDGEGSTK